MTAVAALVALGVLVAFGGAVRTLRGLSFVVRAVGLQGAWRHVADAEAVAHAQRQIRIPLRTSALDARLYAPVQRSRHAVLLVSGLHAAGIDEPRLVAFARELARSGLTVVTPAIPELSRFEISTEIADRIEESAVWLANDRGLAPTRRVAIMGISFSGGLSIVRPAAPLSQ